MSWNRISLEAAGELLDFSAGRPDHRVWGPIGKRQLAGAVALYNRLTDRRIAWIADEVGMGKTFVALGVAALLQHSSPGARVLYLIPSGRLRKKWRDEKTRFTRSVVRMADQRVRALQDHPARELAEPANLRDLAAELVLNPERDFLATLSAFSFSLSNDSSAWSARWTELAKLSLDLPDRPPEHGGDKARFKRDYAAALNKLLPTFDLVICDESHNLRRGAGHGAARNQTVAAALGGDGRDVDVPWTLSPRVKRLLCLTATPVEHDYAELSRQAEVFGFGAGTHDGTARDLAALLEETPIEERKPVAARFVIRRLHELEPQGAVSLTKNQYRREWRYGGVEHHDEPMGVGTPRQQLLVALVQKRVMEELHRSGARRSDGTFLPSFQMGMLSSFESFSETIANRTAGTDKPVYDGEEQTQDTRERQGLDSSQVDAICRSYREKFGTSPPHPKMDQVAEQVARWAVSGEKSLVFVRRVRTTEELADKIGHHLDRWLIERIGSQLSDPVLQDFHAAVEDYRAVRRDPDAARPVAEGDGGDDTGGADTFFAWYFRGSTAPQRDGAHLRSGVLMNTSHPWSILFRDNHVGWLLGDDPETVSRWIDGHRAELEAGARRWLSVVTTVGPRHRYDAWQAAGLELLERADTPAAVAARWLRHHLYPLPRRAPYDGEVGDPHDLLNRQTLFSTLRRHAVGHLLWPRAGDLPRGDAATVHRALEDRVIRRELLASTLRLGHSFTELWVTAVQVAGATRVSAVDAQRSLPELCGRFLKRLDRQQNEAGFHAWRELRAVAKHHDVLVDVNFTELSRDRLTELPRTFQDVLNRQSPVLGMHGGSRSDNALAQFRMPGYPLAIVCTDILQEGVDLHTHCARVVHYGVACTSSATEQRTGRVDRIGSLVHRRFDTKRDESMLQVHFPHLMDTVEPLQLQVLYERMDRFLRLVHDGFGVKEDEASKIQLDHGVAKELVYPPPHRDKLVTAFDVRDEDLTGETLASVTEPDAPDPTEVLETWAHEWSQLDGRLTWEGEVRVLDDGLVAVGSESEDGRRQPFRLEVDTRSDGEGLLVRVTSPAGELNLADETTARTLLDVQSRMLGARLVADLPGPAASLSGVWVRVCSELALACGVTSEVVRRGLLAATTAADWLERQLLPDAEPAPDRPLEAPQVMTTAELRAALLTRRPDLALSAEGDLAVTVPLGHRRHRVTVRESGEWFRLTGTVELLVEDSAPALLARLLHANARFKRASLARESAWIVLRDDVPRDASLDELVGNIVRVARLADECELTSSTSSTPDTDHTAKATKQTREEEQRVAYWEKRCEATVREARRRQRLAAKPTQRGYDEHRWVITHYCLPKVILYAERAGSSKAKQAVDTVKRIEEAVIKQGRVLGDVGRTVIAAAMPDEGAPRPFPPPQGDTGGARGRGEAEAEGHG